MAGAGNLKWTPISGQEFKLRPEEVRSMSETRKRRVYGAQFKAKVGMEAIREVKWIFRPWEASDPEHGKPVTAAG